MYFYIALKKKQLQFTAEVLKLMRVLIDHFEWDKEIYFCLEKYIWPVVAKRCEEFWKEKSKQSLLNIEFSTVISFSIFGWNTMCLLTFIHLVVCLHVTQKNTNVHVSCPYDNGIS